MGPGPASVPQAYSPPRDYSPPRGQQNPVYSVYTRPVSNSQMQPQISYGGGGYGGSNQAQLNPYGGGPSSPAPQNYPYGGGLSAQNSYGGGAPSQPQYGSALTPQSSAGQVWQQTSYGASDNTPAAGGGYVRRSVQDIPKLGKGPGADAALHDHLKIQEVGLEGARVAPQDFPKSSIGPGGQEARAKNKVCDGGGGWGGSGWAGGVGARSVCV